MFPGISVPETPVIASAGDSKCARRWILSKGEADPLCLVDLNGAIHFRNGKPELYLKTYQATGHRLDKTMLRVFGPVL